MSGASPEHTSAFWPSLPDWLEPCELRDMPALAAASPPRSPSAYRQLPGPPPPPRPSVAPPDVVPVLLSDGRRWVWVDPDIAERYRAWSWRIRDRRGYVVLRKGRVRLSLHRAVCQPTRRQQVDHVYSKLPDGKVYNWRTALRVCRPARNAQHRRKGSRGSSRYRGVWWDAARQRWRAQIRAFGKLFSLGRFERERDAALAYDRAARRRHGQFAVLNIPVVAIRPARGG